MERANQTQPHQDTTLWSACSTVLQSKTTQVGAGTADMCAPSCCGALVQPKTKPSYAEEQPNGLYIIPVKDKKNRCNHCNHMQMQCLGVAQNQSQLCQGTTHGLHALQHSSQKMELSAHAATMCQPCCCNTSVWFKPKPAIPSLYDIVLSCSTIVQIDAQPGNTLNNENSKPSFYGLVEKYV